MCFVGNTRRDTKKISTYIIGLQGSILFNLHLFVCIFPQKIQLPGRRFLSLWHRSSSDLYIQQNTCIEGEQDTWVKYSAHVDMIDEHSWYQCFFSISVLLWPECHALKWNKKEFFHAFLCRYIQFKEPRYHADIFRAVSLIGSSDSSNLVGLEELLLLELLSYTDARI